MNSTENIEKENAPETGGGQSAELRGYKSVCAKLGLSMCVYFVLRIASGLITTFIFENAGDLSPAPLALIYYLTVILLSYIIPLTFTVVLFKYTTPFAELYEKPKKMAKAIGTFPAAYGLGYGVALITLIVSLILTNTLGSENQIAELLRPTTIRATSNVAELVMMMFLLIVVAPVFEEFWVRGIFFDALKPYGTGMAIIISSVLFGLMHGSLYMLFYTTAMGLALGYIRYATGSLFTVTILHALTNAVSAIMLLLISLSDGAQGFNRVFNTIEMIFVVFVLALIFAGVGAFIAKIPTIRKYKFENPWTEVSGWKKIGIFCVSVPVLISLVLAFNEVSGHLLTDLFMPY